MFRIEYLRLKQHPQLGDIELFLSELNEITNTAKPYTSVIIGPNGTGKSYILRTIADIFTQFKAYSETGKKDFKLTYSIHLRYQIHGDTYEIVTGRLQLFDRKGIKSSYSFYKNRPFDKDIYGQDIRIDKYSDFRISFQQLAYPDRLLVTSVMMNDRFIWKDSTPEDFYQYLGARSSSSSASTKSSAKRAIKHIFSATTNSLEFILNLKELLKFLGFEESFNVEYKTKIDKLFFSGNLTAENFRKYYEEWWDENFEFSDRKKENPIWSIPYYNNNFKDDLKAINDLVDYLNQLSANESRLKRKNNYSSKILPIDLFSDDLSVAEILKIGHLEKLDIINLEGIKIKKRNSLLLLNELSSGEYHLLISLIGVFSSITQNSLILIDEPEISLHPNWQMRYITFLKDVFANFSGCHFILTTHSHFLVSDLEGESSSVTALNRDSETNKVNAILLEGTNTFGWSAEEVLYSIFNIKSSRNFYVEYDLVKLVSLLNKNSDDFAEMHRILNKLSKLELSENDPLNIIIEKTNKYLNTKNA